MAVVACSSVGPSLAWPTVRTDSLPPPTDRFSNDVFETRWLSGLFETEHLAEVAAVVDTRLGVGPAEQVVEETLDLSSRYALEMLWIVDDNFLVDLDRAQQIAEGLVRRGARFRWSVQATTNLTARLSQETLGLLHRAGLH